MKKIISGILIVLLAVPTFAYADSCRYEFQDGSIDVTADEKWNIKEGERVEWISEEHICARAFEGYYNDQRIDLFLVDCDSVSEDENLSFQKLKKEFFENGKDELYAVLEKYKLHDPYDYLMKVTDEIVCEDRNYIGITLFEDGFEDREIRIYFTKASAESYGIFTVTGEYLYDSMIDEAEKILQTVHMDGCYEYMLEAYDLFGSSGIDGFDIWKFIEPHQGNGDFGDYILGIVIIVIAVIGLLIFLAARKNKGGSEKRISVSYDGTEKEIGTSTYASSESYERSIKTMLESGIITKKEYRELLRKHKKE